MTKIYRSLINGAPFILAMALGLSFMDAHINYWKSAFISLALLNSIKYLIDYEYSDK
jgi:phosphotransferase system  glucose/maltose/N-acetylglucosamine-specific IIC component